MTMSKGNGGIIRVPNYQQFTIIPHNILTDKRLSMKTRGLLVTMLGLPPEWDYSVMGLTKILPDGKKAIGNAIKELEEFGYLVREQERSEGGKFMGYVYTVIPIPEIPFTQKGDTVKSPENKGVSPFTPFRSTEKRSTDFGTQYNINKYNINKSSDDGRSVGRTMRTREMIQQQINYINVSKRNKNLVDDIVHMMLDTYQHVTQTVKLGNRQYDREEIIEVLDLITEDDILSVVEFVSTYKGKIHNPYNFILTLLIQCKNGQDSYWLARVNTETEK